MANVFSGIHSFNQVQSVHRGGNLTERVKQGRGPSIACVKEVPGDKRMANEEWCLAVLMVDGHDCELTRIGRSLGDIIIGHDESSV